MSQTSIQDLAGVTLMDGEEILHEFQRHWSKRMERGLMNVLKPTTFIVTTERVIEHKQRLTGTTTNEHRIRDIHQLQIDTNANTGRFDMGSISFSVKGGGSVTIDGIQRSNDIGNSIRERHRELA